MTLLLGMAFAAPCQFSGVTEETVVMEGLEYAYDEDGTTWATGENFSLGLTLTDGQWISTVGIMVQTDAEMAYDLDIWYLPEGGEEDSELFTITGHLPEGENRGRWPAGVEADELLYSMATAAEEPIGFQVLCETGEETGEYIFRGGGGCQCDGCNFGLGNYSYLVAIPFLLRRRRRL